MDDACTERVRLGSEMPGTVIRLLWYPEAKNGTVILVRVDGADDLLNMNHPDPCSDPPCTQRHSAHCAWSADRNVVRLIGHFMMGLASEGPLVSSGTRFRLSL
ncbi:MAG: hypothetical protein RLZ98_2246 [Pseudomonadota bacterium]|jgi:hypothetical protein